MVARLNNEDRELQIELAQLQTDVQIYLTIAVSFLALFFALITSFQQLIGQTSVCLLKDSYIAGSIIIAILAYFTTTKYVNKMGNKREEMKKLKDKYVK